MALDPKEISARSQKSAYAETGDMTSICMPCTGPVKIEACYDDPWRTPITGAPVRIEDSSGVLLPGVPAGPTTLSLLNFGAQDGMDVVLSIRPELGTFFYPQAQRGALDIALVGDPTAQSEVDALALQINALVAGLKSEMEVALLPWIEEWNDKGIFSIPKAYRNGQLRGLSEWMQEEAGFWASVGNWSLNAFKKAVHLAYQLGVNYYEWYSSLPLIGQIFPLPYWMGEQIVGLMESAYDLWTRRKQIMLLVKGFVNGSVEAIENALKALVDLPGEIGEIITDLVDKSAEWMGATIEMIRETDVLENLTATVFAIVMIMTPNLWAEAIGTVEGYLLPEVLLAIIFTIIAALTAGAGSTLLTARLVAFVAKIKVALAKAGKIGPLLLKIFASLDEIVKSLIQLVTALKRKISEVKHGSTGHKNVIVRNSRKLLKKPLKPNRRHNPCITRGKDFSKKENTMFDPNVDFSQDLIELEKGNFKFDGDNLIVNGRTYGMHSETGTIYPISGPGLIPFDSVEHKFVKDLNTMGYEQAIRKASFTPGMTKEKVEKVLSVWRKCKK